MIRKNQIVENTDQFHVSQTLLDGFYFYSQRCLFINLVEYSLLENYLSCNHKGCLFVLWLAIDRWNLQIQSWLALRLCTWPIIFLFFLHFLKMTILNVICIVCQFKMKNLL